MQHTPFLKIFFIYLLIYFAAVTHGDAFFCQQIGNRAVVLNQVPPGLLQVALSREKVNEVLGDKHRRAGSSLSLPG